MSNRKNNKKPVNKKSNALLIMAISIAIIAIAVVFIKPNKDEGTGTKDNTAPPTTSSSDASTSSETTDEATDEAPTERIASSDQAIATTLNDDGDVVIQVAAITETATFYSYDADGTTVGVLAVKAPDGTIRTALDTCQICNGSPYAFFIQQDDVFQCQNCGNIYSLDMIEQERGGCNPVPIMANEKTVTDTEIIIPAKLFEDNAQRFENWKKF